MEQAIWEKFRLDPRQPQNAQMRASDADREVVRAVLADAFSDGRLTREEYDERLNTLYDSRTLGELPAMVADLVPDHGAAEAPAPRSDLRAQGARKWRRDVEKSASAFLGPTVVCLVIWVLITRGFFWPIFPIVVTGLNLVNTVLQRESIIGHEVERLQQKEAQEELPQSPAQE